MAEAAASSAASAAVALLLLLVAPVLVLVVRRRWRRAAARREEVRRLARLAVEESELAEREAVLAYYSELFPGVVHAAKAPLWAPPAVSSAQDEAEAPPQPPAASKGVCVVCYSPTTMRCKQCKAVKYCSFKCQIAHWRQGHRNECRPPSDDAKPDGGIEVSDAKKGKFEQKRVSEENVMLTDPAAEINKPVAVRSETSDVNHTVERLNNKSKDNPLEVESTTAEASEDGHANNNAKLSQNTGKVELLGPDTFDSRKTESSSEPANFAENGSQKIIGHSSLISDESLDHSSISSSDKGSKVQDAASSEGFSQAGHSEESADNSNSQASGPFGLECRSSRTKDPTHMAASSDGSAQSEQSKTQAFATGNLQSSKHLSSKLIVDKASSVRGGQFVAPNPSKRVDNVREMNLRSSERARATANNLATSLKKIVRQQTVPKVVRHYRSDLTLFPYELFVKLYNSDKVELHPFGLHNLGNSCYANAVLQCLMFTRPLTAYLLEGLHSKNCSKKEWCFMCEFEKLIVEGKWGKTTLSPTGILSHLRDIGNSFGPGKEEDAHEFLRYAIDTMQSVCMKEARKVGAHRLAEETTLVQLIFGGYLRSKIKCTRCQVSSEQCERILDLTVEIDGNISTLEEALQRFTSTEVLDGENRYQCSRCKSYERAKKKLSISEAPNVLTIALKRYQSGKFGKISKAIRFPEYLNLACYMSATDDNSPVYRLYAVVVHQDVMGSSFSGHYVCYVKDPQGKWYKTDDSQVRPVPLENVLSKCAYMLLYARCSPRAPSCVRQEMIAQDPVRVKKTKPKLVDSRSTSLQRGGSFNRHQAGQLHMDHIVDDLTCTLDTFGDTPYPLAESPSPSESSSLFSNSDAGSFSTDSTDSTRNSTSTDEYDYIFGPSDQMYPGCPMVAQEENSYTSSRSMSGLNPSPSGREVDLASEVERPVDHRRLGSREGRVEGNNNSSFLYTDRSKQQFSSELMEQCRKLEGSDHDPGEVRGDVLLRRPAREKTTQIFY